MLTVIVYIGECFDFQVWDTLGLSNYWVDGVFYMYGDDGADQGKITQSSHEWKDQVAYQTVYA